MSRLYAYGIAIGAVILALWLWGDSRYKAGARAAEARMAVLVAEANRKAAQTEKTAQDRVDLLEKDNAEKVSNLDARLAAALARTRPVRVCPPARSSDLREAPVDPGHDPGDPERPGPDREDGDIAPVLLQYARDAEQLRLAVAACKAYGAEIEQFRTESR